MVQEWRAPLRSNTMHLPASAFQDNGRPKKILPAESVWNDQWLEALQEELGYGLDQYGNPVRNVFVRKPRYAA